MRKSVSITAMILVAVVLASSFVGAATAKKKPAVKQPSAQTIKWGKDLCDKADKALANGDYEKARDVYSQVLWKLPASPRAKDGLKKAEVAIKEQQNKERQDALNAARSGQTKAQERMQVDEKLQKEAGLTEKIVWQASYDEALASARSSEKPVVVYCFATDSAECKQVETQTLTNPQVVTASRSAMCVKVDSKDQTTLEKLGNVAVFPTVVVFDATGKEVQRMEGFLAIQEAASDLPQLLKGQQ